MQPDLDHLTVAVEGLDHPEGVTVDPAGTVFAGGESGQVYRVDLDARKVVEVASTGGFVLGLCADAEGLLYCCDVGRRELLVVDPTTGDIGVLSNGTAERPMVNPNWPVFDSDGNLYVTDSGGWKQDNGCIYRVDPSGSTEVWSRSSTNFPNGACLDIDGSSLLVLESCTPALVLIPIEADGTAGDRRVVAELPGTVPDGVALDESGAAFVCCYRPDRILKVDRSGAIEVVADDPEGTIISAPTNGVWVGPERDRLLTGNLGRWHLTLCDVGTKGIPLRYPNRAPS